MMKIIHKFKYKYLTLIVIVYLTITFLWLPTKHILENGTSTIEYHVITDLPQNAVIKYDRIALNLIIIAGAYVGTKSLYKIEDKTKAHKESRENAVKRIPINS